MKPADKNQLIQRGNVLKPIVWGGLVAGILDGADAIIFLGWMRGVLAARIFQFIASGLLGTSAFRSGWTSAAVGVICHFVIATGAAAFYQALVFRWPSILRKPALAGPVFGLGAFVFMHYLVVPLSRTPKGPEGSMGVCANLVLSHILFVGLPIALIASRSSRLLSPAPEPVAPISTNEKNPA